MKNGMFYSASHGSCLALDLPVGRHVFAPDPQAGSLVKPVQLSHAVPEPSSTHVSSFEQNPFAPAEPPKHDVASRNR